MNRILITGAQGFVGGRLARHLAQAGLQVVLGSRHPLTALPWCSGADSVQIDWNDEASLAHACTGVDAVIHTAGMNAQDCAADPVAALQFNGVTTSRLARAAGEAGVGRFVYFSTAHVYASPLVGTISETTCPRNLNPYATSHLAGEQVVLQAGQRYGMESLVLRMSNAFGVPTHRAVNCWMLLVNDLCRQVAETSQMRLLTGGTQQRNFIPLTTVCRHVERLLGAYLDSDTPRIFNIGGPKSLRVIDMANLVQSRCVEMLGKSPPLHCPSPVGEVNGLELDYRTDPLVALTGILECDYAAEIDELLQFCTQNFVQPVERLQ